MNRLTEVILHPFGKGNLTSTGAQYSAVKTTSGDDFEAVESVKVDLPVDLKRSSEPLVEIELGLTCRLQSSGATESVIYKWQYSLDNVTWADLMDAVTYAANASALKEYTDSGRFPVTTFNVVPFWIRLVIKSGGAAGETAKGETKNSSYVKAIYSNN